jgi:hypothetical protein
LLLGESGCALERSEVTSEDAVAGAYTCEVKNTITSSMTGEIEVAVSAPTEQAILERGLKFSNDDIRYL